MTQMFHNGIDYVGQARSFMTARLYLEGRKLGRIPLIEAAQRCREIELVVKLDGKKETYVRG